MTAKLGKKCQVARLHQTPSFLSPWTVPPRGISLVGQSDGSVVEVVAGASLTLHCRVPDARPPPTLLWYLDEKQLPKGGFRQGWRNY